MKHLLTVIVLIMSTLGALAQKNYFIFIQQDAGQPFYARMGEKSYSSSVGGHLILSGLADSTFTLFIGFPKSNAGESVFMVPVHGKDRGFELKKVNGEWELWDILSTDTIQAASAAGKAIGATGEKRSDAYSQLMANVVSDSAVLYGSVVKQEEPKAAVSGAKIETNATKAPASKRSKDTVLVTKKPKDPALVAQVAKADSSAVASPVKKNDTVAGAMRPKDTLALKPAEKSVTAAGADIIRFGSENTDEGKLIIYIDRTAPVYDTIRITIPRL